jgi:tetratricopeptide (TPR) repeat protein
MELSLQDIASDRDARTSGVEHSTKSVLQWLSMTDREWLIVFDNADDDPHMLSKYMPAGNRGNILFTSRNPGVSRYVSREACVEVDHMEEEDAILLLLNSALLDTASAELREAARPIVNELCLLPLAVDQAGAAIRSGLSNIDDYLDIYSRRRQELLADPIFQGASNYGRAVYGTWDLSFMMIKNRATEEAESAIFILQTFAFFHHENIMEEMFKRAAEELKAPTAAAENPSRLLLQANNLPHQLLQLDRGGSWDPLFFRQGIRILLSFSLIKKNGIGNTYSVHPLVHRWSRDRQSPKEQETGSVSAYAILASSIGDGSNAKDYPYHHTLVPHIKAAGQYYAESGIQMPYIDEQYVRFGLVLGASGYWKDAEKLEVQVMETRKKLLGEEHPDTLTSMANLASTYWNQGRWKEAEELEVEVMKTSKRLLGEEHPDTLTSMANLASTYWNQGQWKEAEELEVEVMKTRKRLLGEEHPSTLTSMGNLASTYRNQGRWKEAEELEVEVMKTSKRLLGEEHPDTLTSMGNLASTYWNQGRWKEAEELEVEVMKTRKRLLGEEHPDTLTSMGNLASTYWNQGRWKEAEELEVQVMKTKEAPWRGTSRHSDKHGKPCINISESRAVERGRGAGG